MSVRWSLARPLQVALRKDEVEDEKDDEESIYTEMVRAKYQEMKRKYERLWVFCKARIEGCKLRACARVCVRVRVCACVRVCVLVFRVCPSPPPSPVVPVPSSWLNSSRPLSRRGVTRRFAAPPSVKGASGAPLRPWEW